jgi:hypothetical protein
MPLGHLEKLLVSDKSHVKHGKIHLLAKGLFSGLIGLGEKFEFFEVPLSVPRPCHSAIDDYVNRY